MERLKLSALLFVAGVYDCMCGNEWGKLELWLAKETLLGKGEKKQ